MRVHQCADKLAGLAPGRSVVQPCLEENYSIVADAADDPVLLGQAAGLAVGAHMFQRLGLTYPLEGIAHDGFYNECLRP